MSQKSARQPGFGSYLLAFFVPFLYFFIRGRFIAGIVSLAVCAVSLPLMAIMIGFFTYGIMVLWAIWGVRNESIEAHALRTAEATAQAIVAAQQKSQSAS